VFDCEVLVADCSDAAAFGAALRAEHGLACRKYVVGSIGGVGASTPIQSMLTSTINHPTRTPRNAGWVPFKVTEPQGLKRVAAPKHAAAYGDKAVQQYQAFERAVVVAAVGKERKV